MHQYVLDLFHATEWVARYHKAVEARFLDALARLPSFDPEVDAALQEYIDHCVAALPRGNHCWMFESERYFGSKGAEVRKTGKTPLLAKRVVDPAMRREKVEVQLIDDFEQVPSNVTVLAVA